MTTLFFVVFQIEARAPGLKHYKECARKKTKIVNSKAMNFKIMTTTFKRPRKEFWNKT